MRLAILTLYYPPETGAPQNRLSSLAEELKRRGHDVQVLTALPSYPGSRVYDEFRGKENSVQVVNGVRVCRVGVYVPAQKTFLRRLAHYLSFCATAALRGPSLMTAPDIILIESPPLFISLAGVALAAKYHCRLIANVSDIWPRSAVDLGLLKWKPAIYLAERLERWTYRTADLVTGQTEGILKEISERFPSVPLALFPNGVDLDAFTALAGAFDARKRFGWAEQDYVIGYTGVLGHAQALDQVLDAASLLKGKPHIRIALFGDGPCRAHLATRIATEGLSNVHLYGPQPREAMPAIQTGLDAGLVPLASGGVFQGARPSKMFEVMAAERPIILCATGEAMTLLELLSDGPAGTAVPPEDPSSLAQAILSLSERRDVGRGMGRQGRRIVEMFFDRREIAASMESLLEKTCQRS